MRVIHAPSGLFSDPPPGRPLRQQCGLATILQLNRCTNNKEINTIVVSQGELAKRLSSVGKNETASTSSLLHTLAYAFLLAASATRCESADLRPGYRLAPAPPDPQADQPTSRRSQRHQHRGASRGFNAPSYIQHPRSLDLSPRVALHQIHLHPESRRSDESLQESHPPPRVDKLGRV